MSFDDAWVQRFLRGLTGITVRQWDEILEKKFSRGQNWREARYLALLHAQDKKCEVSLMETLASFGQVWMKVFETNDGLELAYGAILALTVREKLTEQQFTILYEPFQQVILLEERRADVSVLE